MAVVYRGVASVSTDGSAPGAITPAAGTAVGDLLIFHHQSRTAGTDRTCTPPAGFTTIINDTASTSNGLMVVAWKIRASGDTSYQATVGNHVTGASGDSIGQRIYTFGGVNRITPFSFPATSTGAAAGGNWGAYSPNVATCIPGAVVFCMAARLVSVSVDPTSSGNNLTWATCGRINATAGNDITVGACWGRNNTNLTETITSKTITGGSTSGTRRGVLGIIYPEPRRILIS